MDMITNDFNQRIRDGLAAMDQRYPGRRTGALKMSDKLNTQLDQPGGSRRRSVVTGLGHYLPESVVSNEEMSKRVDTSDAWITERTGIRQRHFAAAHETAAFMGAAAAREALASRWG